MFIRRVDNKIKEIMVDQIISELLEHQESEDVLQAVMEEHDNLVSRYLHAPFNDQLHNIVKVRLARRHMPRVDILAFKATEIQFRWGDVITI